MSSQADFSPIKTPSELFCRICFDPQNSQHKLIHPCKCIGSMRYIHEDCLKVWLLSQKKDLSSAECDICRQKFQMSIVIRTRCTCKNLASECLTIAILPILLSIMYAILVVVLVFLIRGIKNNTSSTGQKIYFSIILLACAVIASIITTALVKTIKRGCCSAEMTDWNIESVANEETFDYSPEQCLNSNTMPQEEVPVMMLPEVSLVSGRNVEVPEISTPKLVPIVRDGVVVGYKNKEEILNSFIRDLNSNRLLKLDLSRGSRVVPI